MWSVGLTITSSVCLIALCAKCQKRPIAADDDPLQGEEIRVARLAAFHNERMRQVNESRQLEMDSKVTAEGLQQLQHDDDDDEEEEKKKKDDVRVPVNAEPVVVPGGDELSVHCNKKAEGSHSANPLGSVYISKACNSFIESTCLKELWENGDLVAIISNTTDISQVRVFFICDGNHMDERHHQVHGRLCAVLKGAHNICLFEGVGLGKQVHDNHLRLWAPDAGFDLQHHDDCIGWDVEESVQQGQDLLREAMVGNTALQSVIDDGSLGTHQAEAQADALDFATGHVLRHAEIRNESLKTALKIQCRHLQAESFDCIFVFGGAAHTGDQQVHQLCSQLGVSWAAFYVRTFIKATMKGTTEYYVNGKMQ